MNAMLPGFCAGMWTTPGRARKCAAAPATTMCMHSSRHRASPEHARSVVCAYPRSASNCPPHPRWPAAPFVASTFLTARTQRPYQPHTRARSCEPSPASRNGHARVWSPLHSVSVRRGTRHLAAPWFRTHRDECGDTTTRLPKKLPRGYLALTAYLRTTHAKNRYLSTTRVLKLYHTTT